MYSFMVYVSFQKVFKIIILLPPKLFFLPTNGQRPCTTSSWCLDTSQLINLFHWLLLLSIGFYKLIAPWMYILKVVHMVPTLFYNVFTGNLFQFARNFGINWKKFYLLWILSYLLYNMKLFYSKMNFCSKLVRVCTCCMCFNQVECWHCIDVEIRCYQPSRTSQLLVSLLDPHNVWYICQYFVVSVDRWRC